MSHQDISALEHASRAAIAWVPDSRDDQARYRVLVVAFLPGAAILLAAAAVLGRLLIA